MFTRYAGTPSEVAIRVDLPDYLNDLNAMHEAERVLKHQQWPDYWNWLFVASTRQSGTGKAEYKVAHASAAQRAEAFLRTIGKWEESRPEAQFIPHPDEPTTPNDEVIALRRENAELREALNLAFSIHQMSDRQLGDLIRNCRKIIGSKP
jgi:hypothetical protein